MHRFSINLINVNILIEFLMFQENILLNLIYVIAIFLICCLCQNKMSVQCQSQSETVEYMCVIILLRLSCAVLLK